MASLFRTAVGLLLWAAALYGVLQVGLASDSGAHGHAGVSICGPWGCGPPVRALVGWHGFWLVLVALPVGLLIRWWPIARLKFVGLGLTALGVLMLAGIGIYEAVTWLPNIPDGEPAYFVQRCLFSVVTLTDIPVLPMTLSGIVMVLGAAMRKRAKQRADRAEGGADATRAGKEDTAIAEPVQSLQ